MKDQYITINAEGDDLNKTVINELQRYISRGCYINEINEIKNNYFFDIGISYPDIIIDRNSKPFLKYISINSVFNIKAKKFPTGYNIKIPDRNEVHKDFINKKENLTHLAEQALLSNIGEKLIKLSKVQNGLNPIKEIIINLYDVGELSLNEIYRRKTKEKGKKYLDFLSSLNYIIINNEKVLPGNQLTKFDLVKSTIQDIDKILLEILKRGYKYIKSELNIYILTPYLELANAYYLKSFFAEKLLNMNIIDIEKHYTELYKRYTRKPTYQINANLLEMNGVEIIQKQREGYIGYEDVFSKFNENFNVPYFQ
jgi:hypothetical protein